MSETPEQIAARLYGLWSGQGAQYPATAGTVIERFAALVAPEIAAAENAGRIAGAMRSHVLVAKAFARDFSLEGIFVDHQGFVPLSAVTKTLSDLFDEISSAILAEAGIPSVAAEGDRG